MTEFVKSIDEKHLLTVGLEGFYGPTNPPEKLIVNLGEWCNSIGSDFIRFWKQNFDENFGVHFQMGDLPHSEDGDRELTKPVVSTEF